jgi:pimeloyl-ACP methyl ester carboxylesterase
MLPRRDSAIRVTQMPKAGIPEASAPVVLSTKVVAHHPMGGLAWRGDEGWMPNSQTMLSRLPVVGTAVVFVHGWRGSGVGTWEHFPRALRSAPKAAAVDFYFLEYPSVKPTVAFCADKLRGFLFDLVRKPALEIINPSLPRAAPERPGLFQYERIILVAHSMGAFIARRALLDLDRNGLARPDRDRFEMLFFAPAHKGSQLPLLIESGFGLDWLPGVATIGKLLPRFYRTLEALAVGSGSLTALADDAKELATSRAAADESFDYLRAHVAHAEDDKVVVQDTFYPDRPTDPVMGRDHRTICKPDGTYRRPVTALLDIL